MLKNMSGPRKKMTNMGGIMFNAIIFIFTAVVSFFAWCTNETMAQSGGTDLSGTVIALGVVALSGIAYLTVLALNAYSDRQGCR